MLFLMFPTHLALGYLVSIYSRFAIAPLIVGSAMPDIIDRSLLLLGLAQQPHTLGHSAIVVVPICAIAIHQLGTRAVALIVGWLAHVITDFLNIVTTHGPTIARHYLLYPGSRPETQGEFLTITIHFPFTGVTHTANPGVLVLEAGVLCLALWTGLRDQDIL